MPVAEDGSALACEASDLSAVNALDDTIFGAALDAARGLKWPETFFVDGRSGALPAGVFQTQKRQIKLIAKLFCIEPGHAAEQSLAAQALLLPELQLRDYTAEIRAGPTYRCRAGAIKKILQSLLRNSSLITCVYRLGTLIGLWGSVHVWHQETTHTLTLSNVP